jgi:hypothetical protein
MSKKNIFEMDGAQTRFYKKNGLMFKCSEMFKKIDMFSIPVTLRFKGERNFQTKMGAFTSFVIILAALTIFILNLYDVISRDPLSITYSQNGTPAYKNAFDVS